jgi:hypothetical protein
MDRAESRFETIRGAEASVEGVGARLASPRLTDDAPTR